MGINLVDFFRTKIKKEYKLSFFVTFIFGMLIHFYKFTNPLINHDSVFNFYSSQNVIGSGRWFLAVACGLSSFYDLPWITGLFSMIFIAISVVIIVKVLKISNPVLISIIGLILVSFPGVTETLYFGFTADGYFLAMLFSALAVMFSQIGKNKWYNLLISAVLICLSCGIYQTYVSFGLVVALCYFMVELLEQSYGKKEYRRWIINQAIIYAAGLVLYYIIWQILLKVENKTVTGYQVSIP